MSSASRRSDSGTSSAPASTIVRPSFVPTTMRSSEVSSQFCCQRRVDDELAVDEPDPHGPDGAEERKRRQHERRRRAVDAKDVVRDDHVGRQHGADDLHLVAEALRPERPDRAVDHARGEGGALAGASLALEEAARDLARGVHALFDVDRQREEVGALTGLRASHCGGENHRLARANDDSAVRLLREFAGFEADLLLSNLDGDLRPAIGRDTHKLSSTVLCGGRELEPARSRRARSNFHPPDFWS